MSAARTSSTPAMLSPPAAWRAPPWLRLPPCWPTRWLQRLLCWVPSKASHCSTAWACKVCSSHRLWNATGRRVSVMHKVARFFKTPKGLLTILLFILTIIATPGEGARAVALNMGAAVLAAGIVDLIILRLRNGGWEYPSGAVLTAMIVAMVMRSQEPWLVPVVTSVVAVSSKYLLRTRQANVLNPAAFALVLMFYLMPHGQSWWGALPDVSPPWLRVVLLAGGLYLTSRVNKLPLV